MATKEPTVAREGGKSSETKNAVRNGSRNSSRESAIDKNVRIDLQPGINEPIYGAKSAKSNVLDFLDVNEEYVTEKERKYLKGKTFNDINDGRIGTGRSPVGYDIDETLFQALWNLENRGKIKMKG